MRATVQKASRAKRVHTRTLCTDVAHDAPAMVPMPEMTSPHAASTARPMTDHYARRTVGWN